MRNGGLCAAIGMLAALVAAAQSNTPASKNYVLGPDDQVMVRAMHVSEFPDKPFAISGEGVIQLPLVGRVVAAGRTVGELEGALREKLSEFVNEPQVTVMVTEYRSQPVSVIGAVTKPGVYHLRGSHRLLELISMAEGVRPEAGHMAQITRRAEQGALPLPGAKETEDGKATVAVVNLAEVARGLNTGANIEVKPNDVIAVPQGEKVYVLGDVFKPGMFPVTDGHAVSVLEVLSLAGGPGRTASPQRARILRVIPGGKTRTEMAVDVKKILGGKAPDVALQSDDILFIPNSAAKSATLRSIEAIVQTASGMAIWWPR